MCFFLSDRAAILLFAALGSDLAILSLAEEPLYRSAHGFVDATVHFKPPAWKRKDWGNSDPGVHACTDVLEKAAARTTSGGTARGTSDVETSLLAQNFQGCGWLVGSEFAESAEEVVEEAARRLSNIQRVRETAAARRNHSLGTAACHAPAFYFAPGNFLRALQPYILLRSFVNIGSNDGVYQDDPLQWLASSGAFEWALAVEADPLLCEAHRGNFPNIPVLCEQLRPDRLENAFLPALRRVSQTAATVTAGKSPHDSVDADDVMRQSPDILKVDIDSYDCDLVARLLQHGLRPRLIVMEVNVNVPPPFKFQWLFNSQTADVALHNNMSAWNWMFPLFGCSISSQVDLLSSYSYSLVYFWESDAIFVSSSELSQLRRLGVFAGPLDEYDCFQKVLLDTNGVELRRLRRWLHETSLEEAFGEITDFLKRVYTKYVEKRVPVHFVGLPYALAM